MARDRQTAVGMESVDELARKAAILERELVVQRQAIEKLKELGTSPKASRHTVASTECKTA